MADNNTYRGVESNLRCMRTPWDNEPVPDHTTLVRHLQTIPADWLDLIVAETARRCIKEADEATGSLGADSSAAETTIASIISMWIINKHLRAKCLPEDSIRWVFQIPFQDESETYPFEACPHYHLHPFVRTKPQLNSRGSPSMIYRGHSSNRNVIHGIFFSP